MEITLLKETDVGSLDPLVEEFVAAHKGLSFRPDYRIAFRKWIQRIGSEREAAIFVAKCRTEIIGLAIGTIDDNGPLLLPDRIGYIGMLVVSSEWRGKGIGEALWGKIKKWFLSKGMTEVQLYTEISNEEGCRFWGDRGFNVIMERRQLRIENEV